MEVYFIRHTTPLVDRGICYGQADPDLAGTFPEEQQRVLAQLPAAFDVVFSSPSKRCFYLARKLNCQKLLTDDRLKELNFGAWEMKPWHSLPKESVDHWMSDFVNNAPPGGETMLALQRRVLDWWGELQSGSYKRIAVVTHGGIIRTMNAYLKDIPLAQAFQSFKIAYGGVAFFRV